MKVKSLPKTGKLKEPVYYFGWDAAPRRPDPWQGQADFDEESLCGAPRMGPSTEDMVAPLPHLLLTLSLLALTAPRLSSGSHRCPLSSLFFFFFISVENHPFDSPEAWVPLCWSRSAWGEPLVFEHLMAAQAMALSLLFGGFHGTQSLARRYQFLVCSLLSFRCSIPLVWPEAESNFCSAARHDRAAGSYPGAELAPVSIPGARWTHWGLSVLCICGSVDTNGCDMCLSRENGPHWLPQLPASSRARHLIKPN